jgi:hypothetical protein
MARLPTPQTIVAALTVSERVLLFCLASNTDWQKAGVTHATAQQMLVRGLIECDRGASCFVLTEQGRDPAGSADREGRMIGSLMDGAQRMQSARGAGHTTANCPLEISNEILEGYPSRLLTRPNVLKPPWAQLTAVKLVDQIGRSRLGTDNSAR